MFHDKAKEHCEGAEGLFDVSDEPAAPQPENLPRLPRELHAGGAGESCRTPGELMTAIFWWICFAGLMVSLLGALAAGYRGDAHAQILFSTQANFFAICLARAEQKS